MSGFDLSVLPQLVGQPPIAIGITLAAFVLALRLQRRFPLNPALNPTLLTILMIVGVLEVTGTKYDDYLRSAGFIHWMLGPAVVLLAVPLYRQTALIRASAGVIALALAIGLPVGVASAVGAAWLFGAHPETLLSIAPKSVTTGIAIGVSKEIGGVPALTAVFVILTGITGAVFGPATVRWVGVRDPRILGLSVGISSHGIGTARAFQIGEVQGAFASLGMSLNGVITAIVLPLFVSVFVS